MALGFFLRTRPLSAWSAAHGNFPCSLQAGMESSQQRGRRDCTRGGVGSAPPLKLTTHGKEAGREQKKVALGTSLKCCSMLPEAKDTGVSVDHSLAWMCTVSQALCMQQAGEVAIFSSPIPLSLCSLCTSQWPEGPC